MDSFLDRNYITKWVYVKGSLVAQSAFMIRDYGSDVSDTAVLRESDALDAKPYVPGSSLAGALRDLCKQAGNMGDGLCDKGTISALLGADDDSGNQSYLIVNEAFMGEGAALPRTAARDGVALCEEQRITEKTAKYDYEVVESGTPLEMRLEFVIRDKDCPKCSERCELLLERIAATLTTEGVFLGGKTSRGLGHFKLKQPEVLILEADDQACRQGYVDFTWDDPGFRNLEGLEKTVPLPSPWKSRSYSVEIPQSLLIRDYNNPDTDADCVMLQATKYGEGDTPLVPGTSWAGLIRGSCRQILYDLGLEKDEVKKMLIEAFGSEYEDVQDIKNTESMKKSSVWFSESMFDANTELLRVHRTPIDRFTSGVVKGSFLTEEIIAQVKTSLDIRYTEEWMRELIELAMVDINDAFNTLGGEVAIGRGICCFSDLSLGEDKDGYISGLKELSEKLRDVTRKKGGHDGE